MKQSDSLNSFVEIGKIGRPHGVGGELRVFLHNPSSSLILSLPELWLLCPGAEDVESIRVRGCRWGNGCVLLHLDGVNSIDEAQQRKGCSVYVRRSQLPPPEEGEFYVEDLLGCDVYDGDLYLGKVVSSCDRGGIEVIEVLLDDREVQIPLAPLYLKVMNLADKILLVTNTSDLPIHHVPRRR